MRAAEPRALPVLRQIKFGGHCIKKLELISNRTPTDFARSACVVTLARQVRPDRADKRLGAREDARDNPKNFLAFFARLLPPPLRRKAKKKERKFFGLRRRYKSRRKTVKITI